MKAVFKMSSEIFQKLLNEIYHNYGFTATDMGAVKSPEHQLDNSIIEVSDGIITVADRGSRATINLLEETVVLEGARCSLNCSFTTDVVKLLEKFFDEFEHIDYKESTLTPELPPWKTNEMRDGVRPIPEETIHHRMKTQQTLLICVLTQNLHEYDRLVDGLLDEQIEAIETDGVMAYGPWEWLEWTGLLPDQDTLICSDYLLNRAHRRVSRGNIGQLMPKVEEVAQLAHELRRQLLRRVEYSFE